VKFETPIAKLTPLYNMNTLIVVLLALWIFAEWKEVKVLQLLIGAVLIVMGGVLVARA
jgi:transporter family protein